MSAWSAFDQWVGDTFDPDTDFTPTFEEFMWSFVKLPGHLLRGPSTEDMFYFNLHMLHFGAHYAWHASRVGAYAAWDTFAGYRMAQMLSRPYRVAQVLANPVGAVGAAGIYAGHRNVTQPPPPEYQHQNTPWYFSVAQGLTGGFGVGTWSP